MKLSLLLPLLSLSLVAQNPPTETPKAAPQVATAPKPAETKKPEAKPVDPHAGHDHAKAAEPQPAAKKENKIVAIVGTEIIRDAEVDEALKAMPQQQQMQVQMSPNGREMFIQQYVDSRLLSTKARKDGLDKNDTFKKRVQQAEQQLLATELLNRDGAALQKKLELKDEELKAYFEKHKAQFKQPDTYTARHILVAFKPASEKEKGVTEEEAKAKITKIQEELKKGRSFEELVKEYTDDPGSKETGGQYKDFDPSRMVPEFANAVRTQELNKVGAPVKTQYGYHLVEVLKKTAAVEPTLETAKEQVRQAATTERRELVWKEYLDSIRREIPCVVGDAAAGVAKQLKPEAAKATKPAVKKTSNGASK